MPFFTKQAINELKEELIALNNQHPGLNISAKMDSILAEFDMSMDYSDQELESFYTQLDDFINEIYNQNTNQVLAEKQEQLYKIARELDDDELFKAINTRTNASEAIEHLDKTILKASYSKKIKEKIQDIDDLIAAANAAQQVNNKTQIGTTLNKLKANMDDNLTTARKNSYASQNLALQKELEIIDTHHQQMQQAIMQDGTPEFKQSILLSKLMAIVKSSDAFRKGFPEIQSHDTTLVYKDKLISNINNNNFIQSYIANREIILKAIEKNEVNETTNYNEVYKNLIAAQSKLELHIVFNELNEKLERVLHRESCKKLPEAFRTSIKTYFSKLITEQNQESYALMAKELASLEASVEELKDVDGILDIFHTDQLNDIYANPTESLAKMAIHKQSIERIKDDTIEKQLASVNNAFKERKTNLNKQLAKIKTSARDKILSSEAATNLWKDYHDVETQAAALTKCSDQATMIIKKAEKVETSLGKLDIETQQQLNSKLKLLYDKVAELTESINKNKDINNALKQFEKLDEAVDNFSKNLYLINQLDLELKDLESILTIQEEVTQKITKEQATFCNPNESHRLRGDDIVVYQALIHMKTEFDVDTRILREKKRNIEALKESFINGVYLNHEQRYRNRSEQFNENTKKIYMSRFTERLTKNLNAETLQELSPKSKSRIYKFFVNMINGIIAAFSKEPEKNRFFMTTKSDTETAITNVLEEAKTKLESAEDALTEDKRNTI